MVRADKTWNSEQLAKHVCDILVQEKKLKEKPVFIRTDREAKIAKVFQAANLDGETMNQLGGRAVEVAVRGATQGESWVDDVQQALKSMLSEEAASNTEVAESQELKELRTRMVENAKIEFADGKIPEKPLGPGGGRRESGGRGGSGDRGERTIDDRECYNCGDTGHISRDCPKPRVVDERYSRRSGDHSGYSNRDSYGHRDRRQVGHERFEPRNSGPRDSGPRESGPRDSVASEDLGDIGVGGSWADRS